MFIAILMLVAAICFGGVYAGRKYPYLGIGAQENYHGASPRRARPVKIKKVVLLP
jgi:hypothetical protein